MSKSHLNLGKASEDLATQFLKNNGYKIITRNYKSPLGEIDIIAKDKGAICFIEVKSRSSNRFGLPQEAVSGFKQRQISRVALGFLKEKGLLNSKARFDVVSITYPLEDSPDINLIKDAFELNLDYTY